MSENNLSQNIITLKGLVQKQQQDFEKEIQELKIKAETAKTDAKKKRL